MEKLKKSLKREKRRQNTNKGAGFPLIQLNQWKEHYEKLLMEYRDNFKCTNNNNKSVIGEEIELSLEEVRAAIKSIQNNTAPGSGGIVSELIQCEIANLFWMIHRIIQKALDGENPSKEWT